MGVIVSTWVNVSEEALLCEELENEKALMFEDDCNSMSIDIKRDKGAKEMEYECSISRERRRIGRNPGEEAFRYGNTDSNIEQDDLYQIQ
jgi:hypothetical protein